MKWILFWVVIAWGGMSTGSQDFTSKENCYKAMEIYAKEIKTDERFSGNLDSIKMWCVQQ